MKKTFTILLLAVFSVSIKAQEPDFSVGAFYFKITSPQEVALVSDPNSCNLYSGDITIPDSVFHNGFCYKVTSLGKSVFGLSNLSSLSIPNTVQSIGDECFMGAVFSSSHKLKLPDSLRTIGEAAFLCAENIKQIFIPGLVENIGIDAFGRSSDLNYIGVDTSNQYYISIDGSLYSKDTTTVISVPANISGEFSIPYGVEVIDEFAFDGCRISSVNIPASVRIIKSAAFSSCSNLSEVYIPASVSNIEGGAFRASENLYNLTIDSLNTGYKVIDHCIYSMDMDTLVCCLVPIGDTLRVCDGVEVVAANSCSGLNKLKVVVLPDRVREIKHYAFLESKQLRAIHLPETLKSIDSAAFYMCAGLKELRIPNSVTNIGEEAFAASGIETVFMSDSVKVIPYAAFHGCALESYHGGAAVERIEDMAFYYCIMFEGAIVFPSTLKYIGNYAFDFTGISDVEFTGIIDTIGIYNFGYLRKMILKNTEPPFVTQKVANGISKLIIPCGTTEAYKSDPNWISYSYTEDCDGVEDSPMAAVKVTAGYRSIEVLNAEGYNVAIYDVMGRCHASEPANGNTYRHYSVPTAGVYVVRVNNKGYKVVVR